MNKKNGSKSVSLPFGVGIGSVAANDHLASTEDALERLNDNGSLYLGLGCEVSRLGVHKASNVERKGLPARVSEQGFQLLAARSDGCVPCAEPERSETVSLSRLGRPIIDVYVANTGIARLKGLFAYPPLGATQALMLSPCSAVHTLGMKYTIDVAFLSRRGLVVKIVTLTPWSFAYCRDAHYALEMASGTAQRLNLQVGQLLDVGL